MLKTGAVSIIIGVMCLIYAGALYAQRNSPTRLNFNKYDSQEPVIYDKIQPSRLIISDVGIDLPVVPSQIKDGQWETTNVGVSYLSTSPLPGDRGNSIMYGHNWTNLLGPLVRVKPGDTFTIEFTNQEKRTFTIAGVMTVSPDQTHILNPTNDRRITLYTCTGFMDSKRLVIVAVLQ